MSSGRPSPAILELLEDLPRRVGRTQQWPSPGDVAILQAVIVGDKGALVAQDELQHLIQFAGMAGQVFERIDEEKVGQAISNRSQDADQRIVDVRMHATYDDLGDAWRQV